MKRTTAWMYWEMALAAAEPLRRKKRSILSWIQVMENQMQVWILTPRPAPGKKGAGS